MSYNQYVYLYTSIWLILDCTKSNIFNKIRRTLQAELVSPVNRSVNSPCSARGAFRSTFTSIPCDFQTFFGNIFIII